MHLCGGDPAVIYLEKKLKDCSLPEAHENIFTQCPKTQQISAKTDKLGSFTRISDPGPVFKNLGSGPKF